MPNLEIQETDTNTPETTEESTETKAPAFDAVGFNKAFSAREKAMMQKIEKLLASKAQEEPEPNAPNASNKETAPDPSVLKLQKKVLEMEKRERAAHEKAQRAELGSSLNKLLKDKVSSDWSDLAQEQIQKSVQFQDSNPVFVIDEVPHSLEEGVQHWLSQESNKRFLPSKPQARQVQSSYTGKALSKEDVSKVSASERYALAQDVFLNMKTE